MNLGNKIQPKTYKDLEIWKKSFNTSIKLLSLVKKIPKSPETKIILDQLLRASMSIGANIAEGYGRYKSKEYLRFLRISLGSSNEVDYWLNILLVVSPDNKDEIKNIIFMNIENIKMLSKSIKTIGLK
jgi:four helix bundle protein